MRKGLMLTLSIIVVLAVAVPIFAYAEDQAQPAQKPLVVSDQPITKSQQTGTDESASPPSAVETPSESAAVNQPNPNYSGGDYSPLGKGKESSSLANFELNGYLQTQIGVFTAKSMNQVDSNGFPINHGDKYGKLSMFRNTLQLEADWNPSPKVGLHAVFRGVRSSPLAADAFAQVPVMLADLTYRKDHEVQNDKINWVHDHYYTENDLRELFLDIDATEWLSFRVGRQQVSWGEAGSYRLLDVINPENTTWHLGPFESFKDIRVPLWICKALIDIPQIRHNLEIVWVPLIDDPQNRVTVPLTFVGAWGLPLPPENDYVSPLKIIDKKLIYPGADGLQDSRIGARWRGEIGPANYSLVYYYTHQLSPPIPKYAIEKTNETILGSYFPGGFHPVTVYLYFPRVQIAGGSFEYAIPRPISTVFRVEAAAEINKPYPVNSALAPGTDPTSSTNTSTWVSVKGRDHETRGDIYHEERTTYNWAVVLQRPSQIRWINPTSSIIAQFQVLQTYIPNSPYIKENVNGTMKLSKKYYMVSIPGYDISKVKPLSTTLVGAVLTSYYYGMFNPKIIGIYVPDVDPSGLVSAELGFAFGNHFRPAIGVNQIFGTNPYKGLGLFRDRDEVWARMKVQF